MLNKNLLFLFLFFTAFQLNAQNILSFVDSTKVDGAGIWGGISWNGASINITTMISNQVNLKKFDTDLNDLASPVQLSFSTDYQGTNVADHKHLYLNGYLYVTFMTGGNQELYLLKTDSAGNRIKIVTLETLSNTTYLTNDMHFVTDSTYIYVIYPQPGGLSMYKHVRKYNLALDSIDTYTATSPIPVANLGGTFYKDSLFYMFAGNENQNHLITSRWNMDWTAQTNFADTLIKSVSGEWNYFSTGIAYDAINSLWYIAYHVMLPNSLPDHETLWLAVFDDNFNMLENQQVATAEHFRPHLLLHEGYLYMVYDGSGVIIKKYKVDVSTLSNVLLSQMPSNSVNVYPNPFNEKVRIEFENKSGFQVQAKLYTQLGECLRTYNLTQTEELDFSYLTSSGFYCLVVKDETGINIIKLIKNGTSYE